MLYLTAFVVDFWVEWCIKIKKKPIKIKIIFCWSINSRNCTLLPRETGIWVFSIGSFHPVIGNICWQCDSTRNNDYLHVFSISKVLPIIPNSVIKQMVIVWFNTGWMLRGHRVRGLYQCPQARARWVPGHDDRLRVQVRLPATVCLVARTLVIISNLSLL